MNPPKNLRNKKSRRRLVFFLTSMIALICITFVLINFSSEDKPIVNNQEPPENSGKKIEQLTVEEIIPNEETEFFSKEEGKALLYYSIVNDSVHFFKTNGVDPTTGEKLLPVTQDIIDKYEENLESKKELAVTKTKDFSVSNVKIFKKKEKKKKAVIKKKIKRDSYWNTELINTTMQDEISLFVFNQEDKIDEELTKQFKEEFIKKKYFVTDELIYTSEMTKEIAYHLKSADTEYFKGKLKKYTDYVCIAVVSYSYDDNKYRNDLTDCILKVDYFMYDAKSGQEMFTQEDKVIGSAQTEKEAKKNAIGKFTL